MDWASARPDAVDVQPKWREHCDAPFVWNIDRNGEVNVRLADGRELRLVKTAAFKDGAISRMK